MHCVCEMQERSSHVSTCTTKHELDGVEEWGRGGGGGGGGGVCMGGRTFTCVYLHYQG